MASRRRIGAAVGLAVVLLTAGCVGGLGGAVSATQPAQNSSTIDVSASGQVEAEPNQAVLRVAVETTADSATAVRTQLADNVSRMRAALADAGVGDDQIRSVAFDISRNYDAARDGREPSGYRGIHAFEVTLSDVDRVGTVIDTAVQNGANRVDSVEFALSDDRQRELRADALREAMANARADADVLAAQSNLSVTGVHAVSTGEVQFTTYRTEAATTAGANADVATSVESGPVTVSAQVQVTYNATG